MDLVSKVTLDFPTYHTQGMTKVGDYFYLTSVKVNRAPKNFTSPQNGFDRDQGEGVGYIFKFDKQGKLLKSTILGKDEIYHPGGIDFDGKYIWVPVCEYRPGGRSMIYIVDPETLESRVVTSIPDAIGAVSYNREANELIGMNWGSRLFYKWRINYAKKIPKPVLQSEKGEVNPHFYVDFQDCSYVGKGQMICSGLSTYQNNKGVSFKLGGLELIDMKTYAADRQIPVKEYTPKGVVLTNNPFFIDVINHYLQYYFIPEDDDSTLYIYTSR